jgi:hypothetical protein
MRFTKFMSEKYDSLIKVGDTTTTLFKNPDTGEMNECFGDEGAARGMLLTDTGDVYAWTLKSETNDYQGIVDHEEMLYKMDWMSRPFIPLVFDSTNKTVLMSNYYFAKSPLHGKKSREQLIKIIESNKNIQSLGYQYMKAPVELEPA